MIDKNIKKHPGIKVSYLDKQRSKEILLNVNTKSFTLQNKPGKYDYYIKAEWHNADATYTFW